MPRRKLVDLLPQELRTELDRLIQQRAFGDYVAIADWLAERGYTISKSALIEHGADLRRKVEAVKASTMAAQMIAEASEDAKDDRSGAILSLLQTEIFSTLVALQEANEETDPTDRLQLLSKAARGIADVSRASLGLKKYQAEVENRARAAADAVAKQARKGGMSQDAVDEIRRRILGIAA